MHPGLAVFGRPDPMRDWDLVNPQSINLYQYVRNDPLNAWDPTGEEVYSLVRWLNIGSFANYGGWFARHSFFILEPERPEDFPNVDFIEYNGRRFITIGGHKVAHPNGDYLGVIKNEAMDVQAANEFFGADIKGKKMHPSQVEEVTPLRGASDTDLIQSFIEASENYEANTSNAAFQVPYEALPKETTVESMTSLKCYGANCNSFHNSLLEALGHSEREFLFSPGQEVEIPRFIFLMW